MPGKIVLKRKNKYGVAPREQRTVDGITFHSKAEAERYGELMMLAAAGKIKYLARQVKYPLIVMQVLITTYFADFTYTDSDGKFIAEDVKGVMTPVYRIKKKLMLALYGIDILETGKTRKRKRRKAK